MKQGRPQVPDQQPAQARVLGLQQPVPPMQLRSSRRQ